ncbi:hypothetical protein PR202_ga07981 [Eleusine coracana subsp. coracana]|uniref:Uncharacterized protein n=1 Tax=Eleusine coracana subsp. coracana TaxID=191504 RepID=A0AAV5C0M2_ELECO|nr:hypothetical protein PR202_ga07981 [Eleusine coracana subsp. coracana]
MPRRFVTRDGRACASGLARSIPPRRRQGRTIVQPISCGDTSLCSTSLARRITTCADRRLPSSHSKVLEDL